MRGDKVLEVIRGGGRLSFKNQGSSKKAKWAITGGSFVFRNFPIGGWITAIKQR